MQLISIVELAERTYEAYRKALDNKNFMGNPMPDFKDLSLQQKNGWLEAAKESIRLTGWIEDITLQLIKRGQFNSKIKE